MENHLEDIPVQKVVGELKATISEFHTRVHQSIKKDVFIKVQDLQGVFQRIETIQTEAETFLAAAKSDATQTHQFRTELAGELAQIMQTKLALEDENSSLREQVGRHNDDAFAHERLVEELESKVNCLMKDKESIQSTLETERRSWREQFDRRDDVIIAHEGCLRELESQVTILTEDKDHLNERIAQYSEQVRGTRDETTAHIQTIGKLTSNWTSLQSELVEAQENNKALHSRIKIDESLEKLVAEQSQRSETRANHLQDIMEQRLSERFEAFTLMQSDLEARVSRADEAKLELELQLQYCQKTAGDASVRTAVKLQSLQEGITTLRNDNAAANNRNTALEDDNCSLQRQLQVRQNTFDEASIQAATKIRGLQNNIITLQAAIESAAHRNDALEKDNTSLQRQLKSYQDAIEHDDQQRHSQTSSTGKRTSAMAFTPDIEIAERRSFSVADEPSEVFEPTRGPAILSPYPIDVASVSCIQINTKQVLRGIWDVSIPESLRDMVSGHLNWSVSRSKTFDVRKDDFDLAHNQCQWHRLARHPRDKVCERHHDDKGEDDYFHACSSCQSRSSLCSVLETDGVLVLLPIHPSARMNQRSDLGIADLSYWLAKL